MSKRLLRYQVDHLERRVNNIAQEKRNVTQDERNKAVKAFTKPCDPSIKEMFETLLMTTPKWSKTFMKVKEYRYNQVETQFDLAKASGWQQCIDRDKKAYDRDVARADKKMNARNAKIEKRAQACIDAIVLQGVDQFEERITSFEKEEF